MTAGGLVFIGATSYDKKVRAFDKTTGALLWEATLPFSAAGTPATYEVDGRQFLVVPAGGGKARRPEPSGASTSPSPCQRASEPIRPSLVVFRSGRIPSCST